ncbi:MAG: alpha/beta hydrolase-fold protein, partial [Bacteroidales bacterium]
IAKKDYRAIAGLSMGGFPSLYITINNPDAFGYTGLFSAAVGVTDTSVSPIYADFDSKLAAYFSKKPKLFWTGIGSADFLYKTNHEMRAKFDAAGYPYEYMETDGGHVWKNWRIYLSVFAPKLFR